MVIMKKIKSMVLVLLFGRMVENTLEIGQKENNMGKDLIYRSDQGWVCVKEESHDTMVKRSKDKFVDLVKNTYRVLLTRGMKGCYVYFMDEETRKFFESRITK